MELHLFCSNRLIRIYQELLIKYDLQWSSHTAVNSTKASFWTICMYTEIGQRRYNIQIKITMLSVSVLLLLFVNVPYLITVHWRIIMIIIIMIIIITTTTMIKLPKHTTQMYNMAELIRVCLITLYGGEAVTGWVHCYYNSNTISLSQDITSPFLWKEDLLMFL